MRMDKRYQGPVPARPLPRPSLSAPVCVFASMKSLGPLLCQSRVGTGLETLLRFGSRCVYKLLKSVCILTYEYHVVPTPARNAASVCLGSAASLSSLRGAIEYAHRKLSLIGF